MAKRESVSAFDVDADDEKDGIIGGEMTDRWNVGPSWDWRPDAADAQPAQRPRVIGQLEHGELHTAREGSR